VLTCFKNGHLISLAVGVISPRFPLGSRLEADAESPIFPRDIRKVRILIQGCKGERT
jgi:hypothetical protein